MDLYFAWKFGSFMCWNIWLKIHRNLVATITTFFRNRLRCRRSRQWGCHTHPAKPSHKEEEAQEKIHWSCQLGHWCEFRKYFSYEIVNFFFVQDHRSEESADEVSLPFLFYRLYFLLQKEQGKRICVWHYFFVFVVLFVFVFIPHFFHIKQIYFQFRNCLNTSNFSKIATGEKFIWSLFEKCFGLSNKIIRQRLLVWLTL